MKKLVNWSITKNSNYQIYRYLSKENQIVSLKCKKVQPSNQQLKLFEPYSRLHISSDTAFFKILKSTEINTTSYEPPWCFSLRINKKKFEQPNNQKLKN